MRACKKIVIGTLVTFSIVCSSIPVNAMSEWPVNIPSSPTTTDTWYSGFDESRFYDMESSYDEVYGGDVGMHFYYTNVGMPEAYIRSTSRTVKFELKENDPGDDANEKAREYIGYFEVSDEGLYQPTRYTNTYTNGACIENNSIVELYYRMYVGKINGDTSRNVPRGIANIRFWIE